MPLLVLVVIAIIGQPVISSQEDVTVEEPVVIGLTTNGTFPAIAVFSDNPKQQFPLPGSFTSTIQTCREWQCPRQNLDLIRMGDELIVAAPFDGGICLTKLQAQKSDTFFGNSSSTLLYLNSFLADSSTACTLVGFVNVSIYTAYCIQSVTLYSCGMTINITELSESHFICEQVTTFSSSPNPLSVATSNFVLGDDFRVFFTHGDHLLETSYTEGGIRGHVLRETQSCSNVVYSRGTLYLYCVNGMVLMMDTSGIEIERYTLNGTGIPFHCEGTQASFKVRQGPNYTEIDYNGRPGRQTYRSNGTSFHDAVCVVDSSGTPLLFLIDQVEGLFIANSSSTKLIHLPEACGSTRTCSGLFVYPGPYAVVLGGGGVATSPEMTVYGGKHLNLLRQVNLTNEVTRVGIYIISRPVTETTVSIPPTGKVTTERVSMATELVTDYAGESLPVPIIAESVVGSLLVLAIVGVGVLLIIIFRKRLALFLQKCSGGRYSQKQKPSCPSMQVTPFSQQETNNAKDSTSEEPVMIGSVRVQVTGNRNGGTDTGKDASGGVPNECPAFQPSKLQELKAADAKHGYVLPSPAAQHPRQCSNKC